MIEFEFNKEVYALPENILGKNDCTYTISEQLGKGGNGIVFECENAATGEIFALKILINPKYPRSQRFQREIEVISCLSHPHIITYVTHGNMSVTRKHYSSNLKNLNNQQKCIQPFVVMRKADSNLREFLKNNLSQIRFEDYYGQFVGLTRALEQLHSEAKAIHRDIKPDNILISGEI